MGNVFMQVYPTENSSVDLSSITPLAHSAFKAHFTGHSFLLWTHWKSWQKSWHLCKTHRSLQR